MARDAADEVRPHGGRSVSSDSLQMIALVIADFVGIGIPKHDRVENHKCILYFRTNNLRFKQQGLQVVPELGMLSRGQSQQLPSEWCLPALVRAIGALYRVV